MSQEATVVIVVIVVIVVLLIPLVVLDMQLMGILASAMFYKNFVFVIYKNESNNKT